MITVPVTLTEEKRDLVALVNQCAGRGRGEPETRPLEGRCGEQPGVAPGGTCALNRSCFRDAYGTHVSGFATVRGSRTQVVHFLVSSVTRQGWCPS